MKKVFTMAFIFMGTLTFAQLNTSSPVQDAAAPKVNRDPQTAYFKNYTGTVTISVADMLKLDTIKVHNKASVISDYKVVSFDFTGVIDEKIKITTISEKGNVVTSACKPFLAQVKTGSKVYIDNVVAKDSKGNTIKVLGITFKVQ